MSVYSLLTAAIAGPTLLLGSMWLLGSWFWVPWVAWFMWGWIAWAMAQHKHD